jgi:hypothetical protein
MGVTVSDLRRMCDRLDRTNSYADVPVLVQIDRSQTIDVVSGGQIYYANNQPSLLGAASPPESRTAHDNEDGDSEYEPSRGSGVVRE